MNQSVTFQAEVEASIENFLFMIGNGEHVERALQRIGLHAQSMTQRLIADGLAEALHDDRIDRRVKHAPGHRRIK